MRRRTRRLFGALLGVALALVAVLGVARTARADDVPGPWYVGDSINLYGKHFTNDDASLSSYNPAVFSGTDTSETVPEPVNNGVQWQFLGCIRATNHSGSPGTVSLLLTPPTGKTWDDVPIGFKIKSGDGTQSTPYTFELVYGEWYPLWVGGKQVNSGNKDDVFGDGKVGFSPTAEGAPATLTLNGANITTGHITGGEQRNGIYYYGAEPLTIALSSDNTVDVSGIEGSNNVGIYCQAPGNQSGIGLTITGEGTLTAKGLKDGIRASGDVTISGTTVTASGESYGICGGNVIVTDSTVTAESKAGSWGDVRTAGISVSGGVTVTNSTIRGAVYEGISAIGDVTINSGSVEFTNGGTYEGGAFGIKSYSSGVTIHGGTVELSDFNDGIVAANVTVSGGEVASSSKDNGIRSYYSVDAAGTVTISGGKVSASATNGSGIHGEAAVTIDGGEVTATGGGADGHGICAQCSWSGGLGSVFVNGGNVNASTAGDNGKGIAAYGSDGALTITDGTVSASGTGEYGTGIFSQFTDITISGGTVTATGNAGNGTGISALSGADIIIGNSTVTASGGGRSLGKVRNSIAGTGWTDVDGEQGKAKIAVNADPGQDLSGYKMVKFPEVVTKLTVTVKGGANASSAGGATEQAVEEGGAIKPVTFTANGGYHFEDFEPITSNGVAVRLDGGKVVVFGTPTGNVSITVPGAVADAKPTPTPEPEPTPAKAAKPSTIAHPAAGTIDATWKKVKGAKAYQVQWRVAGAKKWKTKSVKKTSYTIAGLRADTLYDVRVRGVDGSARGAWSKATRRWFKVVSKVRAKAGKAEGSIKVSWKKNGKATGGYKVFVYARRGGKVVATKVVSKSKASATIKGLKSGRTYYVRVRPYRAKGSATYVGILSGYHTAVAK